MPEQPTTDRTIHLTVTVDSSELRTWADKHAAAGNHGVAHVLYQTATDTESVSEQAIREAKAEAWGEGFDAGHETARAVQPGYPAPPPNPYRQEARDA